jgi:hypothetical protein
MRVRRNENWTNGQVGKRAKEMRVRQAESQRSGELDNGRIRQMGKRAKGQTGKRANQMRVRQNEG